MADLKVTSMTSLAAGTALEDVLHIIDDPTGTPINKKVTVGEMLNALATPVALASGNPSLTLPTPIVGMVFRFTYVGAAVDAHNTLIVPPAGVDYEGSLLFYDRDGNTTSVVPSDNDADDTLTLIKPENMDIVITATSTTKYHISGYIQSATAPTIA